MRKNATRGRELALPIFQTTLPHCACLAFHRGHFLLAEVVMSDKHFRLGIENRPTMIRVLRKRSPYSSLMERRSFLISRLMRAASSDDVSNNCAHRLLSPSSLAWPSR